MAYPADQDDDNVQTDQSGGFTNFKKWLDANQGSSSILGGQVAGTVKGATDTVKSDLDALKNVSPDDSYVNNNDSFAGSDADRKINEDLYKANQAAIVASTPGGMETIFKTQSPEITSGGATLDASLTGASKPAMSLIEEAKSQIQPLAQNYQSTTADIQANIDKQVAARNATKDLGGQVRKGGAGEVTTDPGIKDLLDKLIGNIAGNKTTGSSDTTAPGGTDDGTHGRETGGNNEGNIRDIMPDMP